MWSKASTAKRSSPPSVSMIRAAARRAATIFQPPIEPERSRTSTTSRPFSGASPVGGSTVRAKVPPCSSSSGSTASAVVTADSSPTRSRNRKSRSARSPGFSRIRRPVPASSIAVACSVDRTPASGRPAESTSTSRDRSTGFGKPGSSTGGEMRDASGTSSVSSAVPSPTCSPSTGRPGMYFGATTSGNRYVASPSS
jgi:hypothetical protein